jgi:hypothetical protein
MERKDHPTMGKGRRRGRERGVVLAEFVLLLPALLLIIVGIVEFGHLWHLQHTVTNASREGARTAILYRGAYNQATVVTEATQVVDNYLAQFLPAGVWQHRSHCPGHLHHRGQRHRQSHHHRRPDAAGQAGAGRGGIFRGGGGNHHEIGVRQS